MLLDVQASSRFASAIRSAGRYRAGVVAVTCRKTRWKWNGDSSAARDRLVNDSGSARLSRMVLMARLTAAIRIAPVGCPRHILATAQSTADSDRQHSLVVPM